MFPRNIMHNSHIQVCVSSHQLLRTTSFGVTIPGFAFFPTKNKVVVLLGWGAAATTGDMTLLLKIQANLENKYLSHKTMITPLYLNTPLRQGDGTGSLSEGLNSGCTHTSSLAKLSAHTLFCLQWPGPTSQDLMGVEKLHCTGRKRTSEHEKRVRAGTVLSPHEIEDKPCSLSCCKLRILLRIPIKQAGSILTWNKEIASSYCSVSPGVKMSAHQVTSTGGRVCSFYGAAPSPDPQLAASLHKHLEKLNLQILLCCFC